MKSGFKKETVEFELLIKETIQDLVEETVDFRGARFSLGSNQFSTTDGSIVKNKTRFQIEIKSGGTFTKRQTTFLDRIIGGEKFPGCDGLLAILL